MLTIACVLSQHGKDYDNSHVARLQKQVADYIKQPYQFICLRDSPFPGWWAKLSLFEPRRFAGRVLYFDLDVTIVGDLDIVADYPSGFVGAKDALTGGVNTSVMAWDAGTQDHIYKKFSLAIMRSMPGDQDWVNRISLPSRYPKEWFPSFKCDLQCDLKNVSNDAKAIIYHGFPKPWDT